ncbi:hypothetical protein FOA52_001839 [Chlamydomonas sp. UWO 241]|nr:hypothetical protein FOA52_001839 [Chlamydomonas sp. UWO 241]
MGCMSTRMGLMHTVHEQAPPRARASACARLMASSGLDLPLAPDTDKEDTPTSPFLTVVLPTALALLLCNMDRICLSVAILPMSQEFGWHPSFQGVVQSAFLWGYMATQLLGGTLADKYGGKWVMAGGIFWFSIASCLLPLAATPQVAALGLTVPLVLAARCMVGLGEGVALPTMSHLVARFVPKESKSRALGLCFSGFHGGNLLGLLLSPYLLLTYGWRSLFLVFGLLGAPLMAMWLLAVPSNPEVKIASAASSGSGLGGCGGVKFGAEGGTLSFRTAAAAGGASSSAVDPKGVTVKELLSHRATWAIIIVNVVNHWGYFIYLNWMPSYFSLALGFDMRASSLLSFLPWLVMAAGSSASGLLADSLIAKGTDVTTVRKALQSIAFLVPAVALLVLGSPGISPAQAVAAMTVALGTTSLGQAGFVANMSDVAPRHAGKMFGLCNTFGVFAGIVGTTAVGFIVEATGSFATVFYLTAGLYVAAIAAWLVMCTGEKVFD